MVYQFKYDDDDSSLINKQQLASSENLKNGSDTVTANELQVKDLDNKMWIMNGSRKKEAEAKNATTTITESSSNGGFLEMAKNVAVVGGAAIAAGWGLYCLLSSSSSSSSSSPASEKLEKMMKAPGKIGEYIVRQPFEDNPRDYFAQLRNSKR